MKKEPKNDLRYIKTHDLIRATFQEMLLEMEYPKIMIKDLTERARINRRTFYLHYETLDDLLAELQEEMGNCFLEEIKDYQVLHDLEKLFLPFSNAQNPMDGWVNVFFSAQAILLSAELLQIMSICRHGSFPNGFRPVIPLNRISSSLT